MASRSEHTQRQRTRRAGKGFGGCWTCRDRRLKCDEARPVCTRCTRAGLQCQGYSVRLIWTGTPNQAAVGSPVSGASTSKYFQRSKLISPPTLEPSAISRADVAGIQKSLSSRDRLQKPKVSSKALFSVFNAQPTDIASPEAAYTSSSRQPLLCEDAAIQPNEEPSDTDSGILNSNQYDAPQQDHGVPVIWTTLGSQDYGDDFDGSSNHIGYEEISSGISDGERLLSDLGQPNISWRAAVTPFDAEVSISRGTEAEETAAIDQLSPDAAFLSPISVHDHKLPRLQILGSDETHLHLDLLPVPADQCELIHHWVNILSLSMSPIVRQGTPHHNNLMPMALSGLNSDARKSSGEIAVFHGLCAASAFNLSNIKGDDDRFWRLGVRHRHLALFHLRHSMHGDTSPTKDSVWAAIWTFLYQEGVRGQAHEWRTHLEGLRNLILTDIEAIRHNESARPVFESFLCLTVLGNVQLDTELAGLMAKLPPDFGYIEQIHGISRPLLEIILQINSSASSPSHSLDVLADRIELQLLLYCPTNITTGGLDDATAKTLIHYAHVYYYATVIHFQRVLRKKDPTLLQDTVSSAIGHLEAIEVDQTNVHGCIWVWPSVVVGAECTNPQLQRRMFAWFKAKRRHGFKNLEVGCSLARKVWAERAAFPNEGVHWLDFVQGTKYDALPL